MAIRFLYFFVLIIVSVGLKAQTDFDFYNRQERIFCPTIKTNGYGIEYISLKKKTTSKFNFWSVGLSEIKHRKEIKGLNPKYPNESRFVFGKTNHVYSLAGTAGRQLKVYLKRDDKSIGLRIYYGISVECAFLKPVYYKVERIYSQDSSNIVVVKFDESYQNTNIVTRANYFNGFNEIVLTPGFGVKIGSLVDFSRRENTINGIKVGMDFKVFVKPVEIMAGNTGQNMFLGMSLAWVWGKIRDYKLSDRDKANPQGWGKLKNY